VRGGGHDDTYYSIGLIVVVTFGFNDNYQLWPLSVVIIAIDCACAYDGYWSYSLPAGFMKSTFFHALFLFFYFFYWFRSHPKRKNITTAARSLLIANYLAAL
jgi:hypothetical protein